MCAAGSSGQSAPDSAGTGQEIQSDSVAAAAAVVDTAPKPDSLPAAPSDTQRAAPEQGALPALDQPAPVVAPAPVAVPQEAVPKLQERKFSLFNYPVSFSIGLSANYFHYAEDPGLADLTQNFISNYHRTPILDGAPKSTEYGTLWGLSVGGTFYSWESHLLLRPKASVYYAGMQYDGSTQEQPITDSQGKTIGLQFNPVKFPKDNTFLVGGCDIGLAFRRCALPFVIYSGIERRVWFRNLLDNRGSYAQSVSNGETYAWWNLPLGLLITKPVSSDLVAGLDARVDWMLEGTMQASFNSGVGDTVDDYPAVFLSNRKSIKIEPFLERKTSNGLAIKFAPYFQWYSFGRSKTATATSTSNATGEVVPHGFYEPTSTSYLIGFNLSWEFLLAKGL